MNCCENCFEDRFLITLIRDFEKEGNCDYCGSEDVFIIDIGYLTQHFDRLFKHYESTEPYEYYHPEIHDDPSGFGDLLIHLINEDWDIFSDRIEGKGTDENLLFDILNTDKQRDPYDYIDPHNLYSRITDAFTFVHPLEGWEKIWETFKKELKQTNRFFPNTHAEVFNNNFEDVLQKRQTYLAKGLTLYRARLGVQPKEKMLAPPPDLARPGRANPSGISYLYCANDEPSCVAEIRPWKGAKITVAQIELQKELLVMDLNKGQLSPFLFDSPYEVLEIDKLLTYFSEELSTPVEPDKSESEYLPTQYITELIKSKGYDGILFKSAMGKGFNVVIFNNNKVKVKDTRILKVNNIAYEYESSET
ncbi:RES domain-containing protein [Rossellomorea aquimaris]|nr:RES domain-containing protein [Rossellomorea aquimaris]WRP05655.1 RES domain-containing protein [Rossellomorea aquimaris]